MVETVVMSAALVGARKHTAVNTLTTWHWAKASADSSSWPRDLAPLPLPGSVVSHPSAEFEPARQRFDQLSSGVTKPKVKLFELIRYFACTWPAVYCRAPVLVPSPTTVPTKS